MNKKPLAVIDWILSQDFSIYMDPLSSITEWKSVYDKNTNDWAIPADKAMIGGFISDRVAYAFAAGYQASIQRLVPDLPSNAITAVCITEEGGAHPRMIKSSLVPVDAHSGDQSLWKLNGKKQFVTCATDADQLLVAASTGLDQDGKNQIRMVMLSREISGLTFELMKDLPFIPEISHGKITFDNVTVQKSQILAGDGYIEYIKPFRTIEDIHVSIAMLGYLFRVSCQYKWPGSFKEQIISLLVSARTLSIENPLATAVHIATGGFFSQINQLLSSVEPLWAKTDQETRNSWNRDKVLLTIADTARTRRLSAAWAHYE